MESVAPRVLFLSHAAVDEEIAVYLKKALAAAFPGLEVFVSSDPEDLPPGDPWVETVLKNLREAFAVWVLATDRGLSRKWVWFEAGAGWGRKNQFVPCCVGRIRKGQLPPPYSHHIAVNADEEQGLRTAFEQLAKDLGWPISQVDYAEVAGNLTRLDVRAEERAKAQSSPFAAERSERVVDGMAKLQPHEKEVVRQLLIDGQLTDRQAIVFLQNKNLMKSVAIYVFFNIASQTGFVRRVWPPSPNEGISGYEGPWEINPDLKHEIEEYFRRQKGR